MKASMLVVCCDKKGLRRLDFEWLFALGVSFFHTYR